MGKLSADRLRELVSYDAISGVFTRRCDGKEIGFTNNFGSVCVPVDGKSHVAHHLAWLYVHGVSLPDRSRCLVHIDKDKTNNSISNLQLRPGMVDTPSLPMLKSLLDYNPDTGVFTWLKPDSVRVKVGDVAGGVRKGYIQINVLGRRYPAHRLAWYFCTGEWPLNLIDHKDRNPLNNRIANLRPATQKQNAENSKDRVSKTGKRGVIELPSGRFSASIKSNGKRKHLGVFGTAEEAHAKYLEARDAYYTHHNQE